MHKLSVGDVEGERLPDIVEDAQGDTELVRLTDGDAPAVTT